MSRRKVKEGIQLDAFLVAGWDGPDNSFFWQLYVDVPNNEPRMVANSEAIQFDGNDMVEVCLTTIEQLEQDLTENLGLELPDSAKEQLELDKAERGNKVTDFQAAMMARFDKASGIRRQPRD